MIRVLALTGPIRESALIEVARGFAERGAKLSVMGDFDTSALEVPEALAELHHPVPPGSIGDGADAKPVNPKPLKTTASPYERWVRFNADPWFRMQARQADLIVALDRVSIHAAWELAQRLRRPHAIHGVSPALALLDKHLDQPLPVAVSRAGFVPVACRRIARETRRFAIMTAKATARAAASPAVMRSRLGAHAWAAVVATPGLPPSIRVKIAYRTHMNMLAADRAELALATTQAAIAHLPTPRYRAALLMREANSEAARMTPPSLSRAMTA